MKRLHKRLLAAVLFLATVAIAATSCRASRTFSCTKRAGDWGLYLDSPDGPELIACFGGMAASADDERMCESALKGLKEPLPGDPPQHFFCSVFP